MAEKFFVLADKSDHKKVTWLNYQLSRIYFIKGDFDKAIIQADLELVYHPDNCRTHYIRGLTYGYMDNLDYAIKDFQKFNTCFPNTWAGYNDLSWFWFRKGDMKKVVEIINTVKEIYPQNPWIQNTYGVALMNLKRYGEAEIAFKNAKIGIESMTYKDWGRAYPGNNPSVYKEGFEAMKKSIDENLVLILNTNKENK